MSDPQDALPHRAVIALGANLGDPVAALQGAVDALDADPHVQVIAASTVYETDPVGVVDQPVFCNAVVIVRTSLGPRALLELAHRIELDWQRTREVRWGPRTLDVDIVQFDTEAVEEADLTLPHPRAHERGFVIVPWLEIEPQAELIGHGPISALAVDTAGVRATDHRLSIQ